MSSPPPHPVDAGPPPAWLTRVADVAALAVLAAILALPAWRAPGPPRAVAAPAALQPDTLHSCGDDAGRAYLRGRLHGGIDRVIDWSGDGLACGGMLRPQGRGMRLLFAPATPGDGLLIVIGLEATPETLPGAETPANLTIVDEGRGLFFSTGDRPRCWVQAERLGPAGAADGNGYEVAGMLYCLGAVPAVNGAGSLTPGELRFALPVELEDE